MEMSILVQMPIQVCGLLNVTGVLPSQLRTQCPDFREKHHIQHFSQVTDPAGAAGAALEADDPLHRGDVPESPQTKSVFQVGQLFAELVQIPMVIGGAVDLKPGAFNRIARGVGLFPVALGVAVGHVQATPL